MGKAVQYQRRRGRRPRPDTETIVSGTSDRPGPGGVRPSQHACGPYDVEYGDGAGGAACRVCGRTWRYQLPEGRFTYGRIVPTPLTKDKPRG